MYISQRRWQVLVKLTKVDMVNNEPTINRVFLNPQHVISIIEDNLKYHELKEGLIKAGVHEQLSVSVVKVYNGANVETMLIMGSPSTIREKLSNKRQVLRG
jgi:hypothetical protein